MASHIYDFRCGRCGAEFESNQEVQDVVDGYTPACTECGSENTKRVWTFGGFSFRGGLPSNAGRDPMKIWR